MTGQRGGRGGSWGTNPSAVCSWSHGLRQRCPCRLGSQRGHRACPAGGSDPSRVSPDWLPSPGSQPPAYSSCCFSAERTLWRARCLPHPRDPGHRLLREYLLGGAAGPVPQSVHASTVLSLQACRDGQDAGNLTGAKTQAICMKLKKSSDWGTSVATQALRQSHSRTAGTVSVPVSRGCCFYRMCHLFVGNHNRSAR